MYDLFIRSVSEFVQLSPAEWERVFGMLTFRKVKKGQYLLHEGAISRCSLFINKGSLRSYFVDLDGYEHVIQMGIEGWWVGDLQSFTLQQPATLNVQAIEDSEIIELNYDKLQVIFNEIPKFERYFRIKYQHGLAAFQQRLLQNFCLTAEDRYNRFMERYGAFATRIPQKHIASYLGISPEFLSKIKKRSQTKMTSGNTTVTVS